jgi:hypothetical protein
MEICFEFAVILFSVVFILLLKYLASNSSYKDVLAPDGYSHHTT